MRCKKCHKYYDDSFSFCPWCGLAKNAPKRSRRGNGTGSVYKEKYGWTAAVTFGYSTDADGKVKRKYKVKRGCKTKREALEALAIIRNDAPGATIESLWNQYINSQKFQKLSEDKQKHYLSSFKRLAPLYKKDITTLTVPDLQRAVDAYGETYYQRRDAKTMLSHIYQRAMVNQIVTTNLTQFIELPQLQEKKTEPFTAEEIKALWTGWEQGDPFVGYILLMIYTGMMPGELRQHLTVTMIDLDAKMIRGAGMKTDVRKESPIVLADAIIPVLQGLIAQAEGMFLLDISKDQFYRDYYQCLKRLGVRKLTPYSCRHTTATALALTNTPVSVIQKVMRHSKITTTQRYMHPDVASELDAVNRLNKA